MIPDRAGRWFPGGHSLRIAVRRSDRRVHLVGYRSTGFKSLDEESFRSGTAGSFSTGAERLTAPPPVGKVLARLLAFGQRAGRLRTGAVDPLDPRGLRRRAFVA